ncbi:hypothetical protein [Rubripirellula tenax]|uniref:hypothetical protein n=1 Tax=Rubripirellula tenax TaxID=2528015 RepID=UPI0011B7CAD9|nr:hypothetical protein [Rubripirellula tenax]
MLDMAYATMTSGDEVMRNAFLLLTALNNAASLFAIFAAVFGSRRALRGHWVIALLLLLLGYFAILLVRDFVAPRAMEWYIVRSYTG